MWSNKILYIKFLHGLILTCMLTLYRCKVVQKAPYGVFQKPLPFNASDVPSKYGDYTDEGQNVTESSVMKGPKSKHRCSSRDPPSNDTFYLRRTKGRGCKRHRKLYTKTPSTTSRAHTTAPSMTTGHLNATKSSTLTPNKKRGGKKNSTKKGLSAYSTPRSQVPPHVTTNAYHRTTSTTQSTPSLTQTPALQLPTTITAVKTSKSRKKKGRCCGNRKPPRGDTFQPHCKNCHEQNMTSNMTTVTPSTTTYGLPIKVATSRSLMLKKTTETPKQDTLKRLWSTATSAISVTTKLKKAASIHNGKLQKHMKTPLLQNNTSHNTSQDPVGTHAERGLKQNTALHNLTGECMQLLDPSPLLGPFAA